MNIKKILIFIIPVVLLFLVWKLFLYKNEKEKFIESLVNQINSDSYGTETVIKIEPNGTENDENLKTADILIKKIKEGDNKELTIGLKTELKDEKLKESIPIDLHMSVLFDEKKKEYYFDFTNLMSSWKKYAEEEKEKIIYEKNPKGVLEREENETEIKDKTEKYKAIFGEKKYNGDEKLIVKMTEKELRKYLNLDEKEELNIVNVIENFRYSYFQSVVEESYQENIISIQNKEMDTIIDLMIENKIVKSLYNKFVLDEEKKGNEIIEETEFKKLKEKIIGEKAEYRITNTIHDYQRKKKGVEKIRTEILFEKNEDSKLKIYLETNKIKDIKFEVDKKEYIEYKKLGKYEKEEVEVIEENIKIEEEEKEEEWEIENQENPFENENIESSNQDEMMQEKEYVSLKADQFLENEMKKNYEFELIDSFVAGDGNTYNNYSYQYIDEVIGHTISIIKQTIKNGEKEDVIVYQKETRYANGEVIKQNYEVKWENGTQKKTYDGWKE